MTGVEGATDFYSEIYLYCKYYAQSQVEKNNTGGESSKDDMIRYFVSFYMKWVQYGTKEDIDMLHETINELEGSRYITA